MRHEIEAGSALHRVEKLLMLCVLLGSAWAGQHLTGILSKPARFHTIVRQPIQPASVIGAEYFQTSVLDYRPGSDSWNRDQHELTLRLSRVLRRKLPLEYVLSVLPPLMYPLDEFSDYSVAPAFPRSGAVVKHQEGHRQCVKFVWTQIPLRGVRYTLEIAKKKEFPFYRTFGSETNSALINAERTADFFWRVRAALGQNEIVSEVSSFLVLEPDLSEENKRLRGLVTRMRDADAWLNDLSFCDPPKAPAK